MSPYTPARDNFRQIVRHYHESTPVHAFLGFDLVDIEPGFVSAVMPMRNEMTQQNGYLQAGILMALADSVAGMAGLTLLEEGQTLLSVNISSQLMRPAKADRIRAEGTVLKAGSRFHFTARFLAGAARRRSAGRSPTIAFQRASFRKEKFPSTAGRATGAFYKFRHTLPALTRRERAINQRG